MAREVNFTEVNLHHHHGDCLLLISVTKVGTNACQLTLLTTDHE